MLASVFPRHVSLAVSCVFQKTVGRANATDVMARIAVDSVLVVAIKLAAVSAILVTAIVDTAMTAAPSVASHAMRGTDLDVPGMTATAAMTAVADAAISAKV